MDCSCPDGARMCKHLAAVLYGIGARFDHSPELLFTLRGVDHLELIAQAGHGPAIATTPARSSRKTLATSELSDVFGIELSSGTTTDAPPVADSTAELRQTQSAKARKRRPKAMNKALPGKMEKAGKGISPTKPHVTHKKKVN